MSAIQISFHFFSWQDREKIPKQHLGDTVEELKRFNARRKLKGAVQAIAGGLANDPLCGTDTDSGNFQLKSIFFILSELHLAVQVILILLCSIWILFSNFCSNNRYSIGNTKRLGWRRSWFGGRTTCLRCTRWHSCVTRWICWWICTERYAFG